MQDTKSPASYQRIASDIRDRNFGHAPSASVLDGALLNFYGSDLSTRNLTQDTAQRIGLDLVAGEPASSRRAIALDAQARCLEASNSAKGNQLASRLRRMGPSPEVVAYGHEHLSRHVPFAPTLDRTLVEACNMSLVSEPGLDRSARLHGSKTDYVSLHMPGAEPRSEERRTAAVSYFRALEPAALHDAAQAIQETLCAEAADNRESSRQERVAASAVLKSITTGIEHHPKRAQAAIQGIVKKASQKRDDLRPEKPIMILLDASSQVLAERERAILVDRQTSGSTRAKPATAER